MKALEKKLILAAVIFFGLLIAFTFYIHWLGEKKMVALLDGNQSINITRLEINFQQRRLFCTDTDVLRYLKEILAKHPRGMSNTGGGSYEGIFTFANGGQFKGALSIGTNGFYISIPSQAAEEAFPTHCVLLIEPVPEKVQQIFNFLNEPYQKIAGTVLILEEGKSIYTRHDESLVAK
jgi:hypothetical protein